MPFVPKISFIQKFFVELNAIFLKDCFYMLQRFLRKMREESVYIYYTQACLYVVIKVSADDWKSTV